MNVTVPAQTTIMTNPYLVKVTGISLDVLKALSGDLLVTVDGNLDVLVDQFPLVQVHYTQSSITASLSLF